MNTTLTADVIKFNFTGNAYYNGHIVASEVERQFKPDILTIDRNLMMNEYEIKVSLSDLRKELDYIEMVIEDERNGLQQGDGLSLFMNVDFDDEPLRALNKSRKYHTSDNKYIKHRLYLFNKMGYVTRQGVRPNRFYFLLPKELYEIERKRIDAIPKYGVIEASTFFSLKRCQQIHKEPADAYTVWNAAQNIMGRYFNARKEEL